MKWFVTGLMFAGAGLWYVMNTRIQKLEARVAFIETRVMAELTEQDRRVKQMLDWMDELNSNRTYIIKNVPETDFEITIQGKKHE